MAVVSATESLPTGAVTKASHPSAPRAVHAVKGNAKATVSWSKPPPTTLQGQGQQDVGPLAGGSSLRLNATNNSTQGGNFIVEIVGANGSPQGYPINVIGCYSGSVIANDLSDGPYHVEVDSDGT
jgi:hypothetical protein